MRVRRAAFDVFDTLLARMVLPDAEVWREVGRQAAHQGLVDCAPDAFAALRIGAARNVRRLGPPPLFEDIESELARLLGIGAERVRQVMLLELNVEASILRPVAGGRRLVQSARIRTSEPLLFISDMHLPSSFLRAQLQRFSMWGPGDRIWVSCEAGARKSDGSLFPIVAAHEDLRPPEIVHTGDAQLGDDIAARWTGLRTAPYTQGRPNRYERLLASELRTGDSPAGWLAGAARQARLELNEAEGERRGREVDPALQHIAVGVAGPLLVSYGLWLLQQAQALGKTRLYFLSRDGQVLQQVTSALARQLDIPVECRYLHGGRLAWQLPALATDGGDADVHALVAKATSSYTKITLGGIAVRIGLSADHLGARSGLAGTDGATPLSTDARQRVQAWLSSPDGVNDVLAVARTELPLARTYLSQQGLLDDDAWALVDVGWSGGTVRALNRLLTAGGHLPATALFIGYVGPGGDQRLPNCHSFLWDTDAESPRDRAPGAMGLVEAMCSGTHGPVAGYQMTSTGTVEPRLVSGRGVADATWALREFRVALFAYLDLVRPQLRPTHVSAVGADPAAAVLNELCRHPSADEARALGSCPREEDAQGTSVFPVARPFVLADLASLYRPGPMFGRNLGWVQGALACTPAPRRQVFRVVIGVIRLLRVGGEAHSRLWQIVAGVRHR